MKNRGTIIITGGAGFIGSVLCKELNDQGYTDIILVDRLRDKSKWLNLNGLKFCDYVYADDLFSYLEEKLEIQKEIHTIFHMGACSTTTQKDVDYLMSNNFLYSKRIFELATKLKCNLIYASSAATYGDGREGYSDDHELIPKLRPLNPYGFSKQIFDKWVLENAASAAATAMVVPPFWIGLKFFNVFGPQEYHKESMSSVVFKAFEQIKSQGKVKLFRSHDQNYLDGEQMRDFIYARDVARAMIELSMLMLDQNSKVSANISGIYNMGTGIARSFKDLVLAVFKSMNIDPVIEYIDMPADIKNQYQYYTKAEMKRFNKLIPGFKFTSLEDAVDDYVKNFLNSTDRYF
ncbi:MAG: ADP-glyceromanno-heptose 6-epimerase [Oligoflexia bacterium]|nr:ADP-glyceromanno-heptose 6-epimerase [Oligoflexia bacterium]